MKEYLMDAAKLAAMLVVIGLVQKNVFSVPVIGEYLPGYTPAAK
jgi:hypothetical protein